MLTLPNDIPGLIRECSPVYSERDQLHGVVFGQWHDDSWLFVARTEGYGDVHRLDESYGLSLESATGRAHAAWWLIAQGGQAAWWGDMWLRSHRSADRDWTMCTASKFPLSAALRGITNDPRTLPDGSRYVDALALKLVVLHVAGRTA